MKKLHLILFAPDSHYSHKSTDSRNSSQHAIFNETLIMIEKQIGSHTNEELLMANFRNHLSMENAEPLAR